MWFWESWGGLEGSFGGFGGVWAGRLGMSGAALLRDSVFVKFWGPRGPKVEPCWGHVGAKLALFRVILVIFVISKLNFNLKGV